MKSKFFLVVFFCAMASALFAQLKNMRYDIECAGNGAQGTNLVKVWVFGKEKDVNLDVIKYCAVHGVIFKGFVGTNGCAPQKPMATSPVLERERANFFGPFFNTDKAYDKYVTQVQGNFERVKVGREIKIGTVVTVSKDMLRRDLEAAGIIRGLSTGF